MKPRIDPQRWKQIDDLLDAAIDLEPGKRSGYLDQACGNDQDLRKKVEELLKSDQHAEDFISLPVLDPASKYLDHKIELFEREVIADRYELVSRLGTGGMGEVWLAFDLKLRVNLVLKTLHFHLIRTPHRVEALRREVLNARNVISPNVCRIFDLVIDDDRDFISMEHIDGMTLAAMLKSTGPLPLSKALDIASQFLTGLQAIHDARLVHCDLKPENIMITQTGRVVVMDFGIAKQMDQTRSTISGTPAYMSPEQLCGAAVDAKTWNNKEGNLGWAIHPKGSSIAYEKSTGMVLTFGLNGFIMEPFRSTHGDTNTQEDSRPPLRPAQTERGTAPKKHEQRSTCASGAIPDQLFS